MAYPMNQQAGYPGQPYGYPGVSAYPQTPYYTQPQQGLLEQYKQQQYQPPQMMQPMNQPFQGPAAPAAQTGTVDDRIWVQGETAATAYLVAANGFVRLWDSTAPVFYEKQADATGKPLPMMVYDYKLRGGEQKMAQEKSIDYSEQLSALADKNAALEKRVEALEKKRTTQTKQKEAEGNE